MYIIVQLPIVLPDKGQRLRSSFNEADKKGVQWQTIIKVLQNNAEKTGGYNILFRFNSFTATYVFEKLNQ